MNTIFSRGHKESFVVSSIGTMNIKDDGWYYQGEEELEPWTPDQQERLLWNFARRILQFKGSICKDGKVYHFLGDGNAKTEETTKIISQIKIDPQLKTLEIILANKDHIYIEKIDFSSGLKVAALFKAFPVTNLCTKNILPEGLHKMNEIYLDVTKDAVYVYKKSSYYYSMKKTEQILTDKGVSIDGTDIDINNEIWSNLHRVTVPYKSFEAFLVHSKKIFLLSKTLCGNNQTYEFLGDGRVRVGSQKLVPIKFRSKSGRVIVRIGDQEISLDAKAREFVPLFLNHFTDKSGNVCASEKINTGKYAVSYFHFEVVGSSVYIYLNFLDHFTVMKTTQTVTDQGHVIFAGLTDILVQDGLHWKLSHGSLQVIIELPKNYDVVKGLIDIKRRYCKGETVYKFLGDGTVKIFDEIFVIEFYPGANGKIKLQTMYGQVLGEVNATTRINDLSSLGREDCHIIKPGYYCDKGEGKLFIITEDIGWRVTINNQYKSFLIEPFSQIYTDSGQTSISQIAFTWQEVTESFTSTSNRCGGLPTDTFDWYEKLKVQFSEIREKLYCSPGKREINFQTFTFGETNRFKVSILIDRVERDYVTISLKLGDKEVVKSDIILLSNVSIGNILVKLHLMEKNRDYC